MATLGVHRAAISSFLDPLGLSISSKLLARFMGAVFLSGPPARSSPCSTWNVAVVLEFIRSWGDIQDLPLDRLSWRTFSLVLLFSCRHIRDLVFLCIDAPFLSFSEGSVVMQLGFGLKQCRPSHRSPVIRLIQSSDERLCPVAHIRAYLSVTESIRTSRALILTIPPHNAAARMTLRQWFARVLQGAGVRASPGSSRATVASVALVHGVPENAIMQAADWASARTLFNNNIHLLPSEVLRGMSTSS